MASRLNASETKMEEFQTRLNQSEKELQKARGLKVVWHEERHNLAYDCPYQSFVAGSQRFHELCLFKGCIFNGVL